LCSDRADSVTFTLNMNMFYVLNQSITMSSLRNFSILLCCLPAVLACANTALHSHNATDTASVQPNTIRVTGLVKSMDKNSLTLMVLEMKGEGQGIINPLSVGQEVTIAIRKKTKNMKGAKIEALLKEEIGIDASQSAYSLIWYKELKN
jgi:hypothetical protein